MQFSRKGGVRVICSFRCWMGLYAVSEVGRVYTVSEVGRGFMQFPRLGEVSILHMLLPIRFLLHQYSSAGFLSLDSLQRSSYHTGFHFHILLPT